MFGLKFLKYWLIYYKQVVFTVKKTNISFKSNLTIFIIANFPYDETFHELAACYLEVGISILQRCKQTSIRTDDAGPD